MNKSKLERKASKGILIVPIIFDNNNCYIAFCDYDRHRGIIEPRRERTCINRKCDYYKRLYIK